MRYLLSGVCVLWATIASAFTIVDLPPPALANPGLYVHAGSQGTGFDGDGNITGRCIYWSDPIKIGLGRGGRRLTIVRFEGADCVWNQAGTLTDIGPLVVETETQAFATPTGTAYYLDATHLVLAIRGDGTMTGRTIPTVIGFVATP